MLGAAADLGFDAVQRNFGLQPLDDALDIGLAVGTLFVELRGDGLVGIRFQIAERPVFHLPLDLPHAEPVRQRGEQFACLLSQRLPRGLILTGRAAQRMGALRQFDQHDANILHHGQHHLPQGLELGVRIEPLVGGAGG